MSKIQTCSPLNNKVIKTYAEMSPEELESLIDLSSKTQKTWRCTPLAERAKVLDNMARIMSERKDELSRICALEMGKRYAEGIEEIEICVGIFRYYAENGAALLRDKIVDRKSPKRRAQR